MRIPSCTYPFVAPAVAGVAFLKNIVKTTRITPAITAGIAQKFCHCAMPPVCGDHGVVDPSGDQRTDEHPDTVRHEHQEPLRLSADRGRGDLVHVDLSGHKEEVVADAVQNDAAHDHPDHAGRGCKSEQNVAQHPGEHADHEHPLDPHPPEEQRHEQG